MCSEARYPSPVVAAAATLVPAAGLRSVATAATAPALPALAAIRKLRRLVDFVFIPRLLFVDSIQLERFGFNGQERQPQVSDFPIVVGLRGARHGTKELPG